jgi:hypothetical protein
MFGYLLCLHIQLVIQSNVDQGNAVVQLDNSPVPRTTPQTKMKAKAEAKAAVDVQQLADALTRSFSAEDGIASDDRIGFEISLFQDSQHNPNSSTCRCDIVSTDCLDAIACMQDLHNPQQRHAMAWIGIQLRRAIRTTTKFAGWNEDDFWTEIPLGKLLQYSTIQAWTKWRKWNIFPEYNPQLKSTFVQEELYPNCLIHHGQTTIQHKGVTCFYQSPKDPEESAGTIIEDEANQWYSATISKGMDDTQKQIHKTLEDFFRAHQPRTINPDLEAAAKYDAHFSSLGNLMIFAHITRMLFNRRPFLDKIYQEKLTSVVVPGSENGENNFQTETDNEPYIVALHMRRGDSCGDPNPQESNPQDYQSEATPLDSKAQTGNDRKCYQTHVYLDAVLRIRRLVPETRPLHVYLATDDVGNVVHEILNKKYTIREIEKKNMTIDDNILGVDKWHFLNYSRAHFNYTADSIEADENIENQPILGESAIADLWLLSHGQAFVGHLGSRFGKVAWLLATARRNNFVPFFSVDGHSEYGFVRFCQRPGSVIIIIIIVMVSWFLSW